MSIRRILVSSFMVALAITVGFGLLPGCESKPAAPDYNNVFDGEDPLNPMAVIGDSTITLSWTQPQGYNIAEYILSHSFDGFEYTNFDTVEHTTTDVGVGFYSNAAPTTLHWFQVVAMNEQGERSLTSEQIAATVMMPPQVMFDTGDRELTTRFSHLTITVENGDSLAVADNPQFTDMQTYAVIQPGEAQVVEWTLDPAPNGHKYFVYVASFTADAWSPTRVDSAEVSFEPTFRAAGGSATVATQIIDLIVADRGVDSMRFAPSEAELVDKPWTPGADLFEGYELADSANPQEIYGEFAGDFGFSIVNDYTARPDPLLDVEFRLAVPQDHVSDQSTVIGICDATASLVRYAEGLDFSAAPWLAYSDTLLIELSPEPGRKVIYVQYRNDWNDSAVLNDYVDYLSQPMEVAFLAPSDGAIVLGGSALQIMGVSTAESGTESVDGVEIDTGDGNGFQPATGTDQWTYLWDIPLLESDTDVVLRARAYVGEGEEQESVTTAIMVTISQLTISIVTPADDDVVEAGVELEITGTAAPFIDGPELDSVSLQINGEDVDTFGEEDWSATWLVPDYAEDTPVTIVATAHAGADAVADTVKVTITP